MFCRYALRTTDLAAARAFYAEAIGLALPEGAAEGSSLEAWPLHERALAAGAPPHWLGMLAVHDVEAKLGKLLSAGSQPLAPIMSGRDGVPFATLRDPFGDVIGLRARSSGDVAAPVVWHQLHTRDADGAAAFYREHFGWAAKQTLDFPKLEGGFRLFAWDDASPAAGAIGNTARWPGVHTHWCFYFPVSDLDAAMARVSKLGGKVLEPATLPGGMRIVACDDPQGGAFGMAQLSGERA